MSDILNRIAGDQSCWYLVSFDPKGWDTDRALQLGVRAKSPGLKLKAQSFLVVPSRTRLAETRLLAAHLGDSGSDDRPLSVSLYPIGGTADRLQVMAQTLLPAGFSPDQPDNTWDVGIEVVARQAIASQTSGRVSWRANGQPLVYQATLSIPSGTYEVVAVARNLVSGTIRQGRAVGRWPPSSGDGVTVSTPVLAQPQRGQIVRDGDAKESGIVIRGDGTIVDPREPIAIVTAVCMKARSNDVIRAERKLVGESEVPFAPMRLTPNDGGCVQIRDLVAAGSIGAGELTYFLRILSGDTAIAAQRLTFHVGEIPAASPPFMPLATRAVTQ